MSLLHSIPKEITLPDYVIRAVCRYRLDYPNTDIEKLHWDGRNLWWKSIEYDQRWVCMDSSNPESNGCGGWDTYYLGATQTLPTFDMSMLNPKD